MIKTYAFGAQDPDFSAVEAFIQDQFGKPVALNVDARDEMFNFGLAVCPASRSMAVLGYFRAGFEIDLALRQFIAWKSGGPVQVGKILDFACGYGRATRFLAAELGPERVWASDILEGAVEFQRDELGVHAFRSALRPEALNCAEEFDFIFVCSLFSHLPERTFVPWLKRLFRLLAPNGMLAFSVHDNTLRKPAAAMPSSGHFFEASTEIEALDTADYGVAIVTEEFVKRAIGSATGKTEYCRVVGGLTFQQDVYLVSKGALPVAPLKFVHTPHGHLDHCVWNKADEFVLSGWAVDFDLGQRIAAVEIFVNGTLCGTTTVTATKRPDIVEHAKHFVGEHHNARFLYSGWSCTIRVPQPIRPFSDILLAKAISTSGSQVVLRAGVLNTMLTLPMRTQ